MAKKAHIHTITNIGYEPVANEQLLTLEEAAEMMRCTERTLQAKDIPHHLVGKRVFYLKSELFKWVASQPRKRYRVGS